MKILDLTGLQIVKITVVRPAGFAKDGHKIWECLCNCGRSFLRASHALGQRRDRNRNPRLVSCGKCHVQRRLRPFEWLYNALCRAAKTRTKCGVEFSFDDFLQFTKIPTCHYCGIDLVWTAYQSKGNVHKSRPTCRYNLDRRNSKIGYLLENVVVCCPRCNMSKRHAFSYEEWYGMAEYLRRKNAK